MRREHFNGPTIRHTIHPMFGLVPLAVDNLGNSYVTAGSTAAIQKISPAGALVWNNANPGGLFSNDEFWSISFNCDQSMLVVGGTGGSGLNLTASIYNIDIAT